MLIFVGANPCIVHPIMWQRVCRNTLRPEIIVLDPRKTETAMAATQHYAIRPKSDLILLYGLANRLIADAWIDREFIDRHTSGFDAFAELSDFNIFKLVAQYWGCGRMFERWSSPEVVFQIMKELSRDQPCEITGIRDYQMIDEAGGIQWPLPDTPEDASAERADQSEKSTISVEQERRLFENGLFCHSDKNAKFLFEAPRDEPELPDEEYPFVLLTGRGTSSQWHTQTRTGKSAVLKKLYPDHIYMEMNPLDAERLAIGANQKAIVASRRAKVTATVFITNTVQAGQLFIPMHYSVANQLTYPAFDPYSRQPAYKSCAVSVTPLSANGQDLLRCYPRPPSNRNWKACNGCNHLCNMRLISDLSFSGFQSEARNTHRAE